MRSIMRDVIRNDLHGIIGALGYPRAYSEGRRSDISDLDERSGSFMAEARRIALLRY